MAKVEQKGIGWTLITNDEEYSFLIWLVLADKDIWQISVAVVNEDSQTEIIFENESQAQAVADKINQFFQHQDRLLAEKLIKESLIPNTKPPPI